MLWLVIGYFLGFLTAALLNVAKDPPPPKQYFPCELNNGQCHMDCPLLGKCKIP